MKHHYIPAWLVANFGSAMASGYVPAARRDAVVRHDSAMLADRTKYRKWPVLALSKRSGTIVRKAAEDMFYEDDLYSLIDTGPPLDQAILRYAAQLLRERSVEFELNDLLDVLQFRQAQLNKQEIEHKDTASLDRRLKQAARRILDAEGSSMAPTDTEVRELCSALVIMRTRNPVFIRHYFPKMLRRITSDPKADQQYLLLRSQHPKPDCLPQSFEALFGAFHRNLFPLLLGQSIRSNQGQTFGGHQDEIWERGLCIRLLEAAPDSMGFVLGDNPCRPFRFDGSLKRLLHDSLIGFQERNVVIVLPLTPRFALMGYIPPATSPVRRFGHWTATADEVRHLNAVAYVSAQNWLVLPTDNVDGLLDAGVADIRRPRWPKDP